MPLYILENEQASRRKPAALTVSRHSVPSEFICYDATPLLCCAAKSSRLLCQQEPLLSAELLMLSRSKAADPVWRTGTSVTVVVRA